MESGNSEQETAASLRFCTCFAIVPVIAAVFQCSRGNRTPPLLVCESHDVYSYKQSWFLPDQLVFARTWPLSRVVFARAWPLSRSAQLCFTHIVPGRACEANDPKIGPKISQISRYIGQISWRFEIDRPKGLKEARRCRSVRKLLFPFVRARAKCGRNGRSMHTHGGSRVRQTPKVLRLRSSFGRTGETKFALKWVGRTDRARNKALWTHWGP